MDPTRIALTAAAAAFCFFALESGWGWDQAAGLWSDPLRLLASLGFFVFLFGFGLSRMQLNPKGRQALWQLLFFLANLVVFPMMLLMSGRMARHHETYGFWIVSTPWAAILGLTLEAGGVGIMLWSINTLGRWFSPKITVQQGHRLIQSGPYRFVRHPFYTGLLLFLSGFPLAFGSLMGCFLAACYLPAVLLRISNEERLLAEAFKNEFPAYRQRTRLLIPFIL